MTKKLENLYYKVDSFYHKFRLDKFLALHAVQFSRSNIKQSIKLGHVKINDLTLTEPSALVKFEDIISFETYESKKSNLEVNDVFFEIIFEDDHLLVINKPSGLTVHPGAGQHNNTLVNGLLNHCGINLSNIGDPIRPGIIHRLDKDTSGLLIVAKDNPSHAKLVKDLADRLIKRSYLAFIYGMVCPPVDTIKTFYGRSRRDRKLWSVLRDTGKIAITHYKTLEIYNKAVSLIECNLETGRTHQIRVHLTHKGCPILGDQTYGKSRNYNLNAINPEAKILIKDLKRQALHAYKIAFTHPITREEMQFEIPLSEDLLTLKELLMAGND